MDIKYSNFVLPKIRSLRNLFHGRTNNHLESQPIQDCYKTAPIELNAIKSKTVERLFSPEFKPDERISPHGYGVTTVIDRRTQKPVKAYVIAIKEKENPLKEKWLIMVKDSKGETKLPDGNYHIIGKEHFYLDTTNKVLSPRVENFKKNKTLYQKLDSFMVSTDADKYEGVGVRLHQIMLERMIGLGFKNAQIAAVGNTFMFHKKLGFNVYADSCPISNREDLLKSMSKINHQTKTQNSKHLQYNYHASGSSIDVASTIDNMLYAHYSKNNNPLDYVPNMRLSEQAKADWLKLINTQPITLNIGK